MLGVFIDSAISGLHRQVDYTDVRCFFWVVALPRVVERGQTLKSAILALGTASFGLQSGDQKLFYDAAAHYGKALAHLRSDLMQPATSLSDTTLCACLVALLYQYFTDRPDKQGFIGHIMGLAQILYLRGPASFQEGLAHDLFLCCRINIIMVSLLLQRKTFLASREWRTIPFEKSEKSEMERLIDNMTVLPELRARMTEVSIRHEEMSDVDLIKLTENIWTVIVKTMQTYRGMAETSRACGVVATSVPELYSEPDNAAFPLSHMFPSLRIGSMMTSFWSILIDLYNMQGQLYDILHQRKADVPLHPLSTRCDTCLTTLFAPTSPPGTFADHSDKSLHQSEYFCTGGSFPVLVSYASEYYYSSPALQLSQDCKVLAQTFALQICMSIQYCVQPGFKVTGPMIMMFAMKMALRCFKVNPLATPEQLEWAYRTTAFFENGVPLTTPVFEDLRSIGTVPTSVPNAAG